MSAVLVIGNGFDRKIGLKTDYFSFLNWMQKKGYGVGKNLSEISHKMILGTVENKRFTSDFPRNKIKNTEYYNDFITNKNYDKIYIKNYLDFDYLNFKIDNNFKFSKADKQIHFFLPDIIQGANRKNTKLNIWYCFLQILRNQTQISEHCNEILEFTKKYSNFINEEGNWIDIEGIIKKTISEISSNPSIGINKINFLRFALILKLPEMCLEELNQMQITLNNKDSSALILKLKEVILKDFIEFKGTLSNYIRFESDKNNLDWENLYHLFDTKTKNKLNPTKYNFIINFNYTNYFKPDKKYNVKVYNVHGTIADGEKIVFGLDPYEKDDTPQQLIALNEIERKLLNDTCLKKFTKISQLLSLQKNKYENTIENNISSIVIIGHSLGIQDYSYFFSLLYNNDKNIKIECLWYKWGNGKFNNEYSIESALFEMLLQYERHVKKKVLHTMIFEGRIKFTEVKFPNNK